MKVFLYCFLFLILVLVGGAAGGYYYVDHELQGISEMKTSTKMVYKVKQGTTIYDIIHDIFNYQIDDPAKLYIFKYWLKKHPELTAIKAGTYEIGEQLSITSVLEIMVLGKEATFNVTLIEGNKITDFLKIIAGNKNLKHELEENITPAKLAQLLGIPHENPEGWFMPDTYVCRHGDSDIDLLKRSYETMKSFLAEEYAKKAEGLPYNDEYEVLIMASIVERETAVADERTKVASVFVNRLNKGMKLQTDPTVIYGLGDKYKGKIYKSSLADQNPYNTYIIDGLPPTPIAMPSRASIRAALHPDNTDYLFFVAKGPNSRDGHNFSVTEKEHNKAVANYRKLVKEYKENKSKSNNRDSKENKANIENNDSKDEKEATTEEVKKD